MIRSSYFQDSERDDYDDGPSPREDFVRDPNEDLSVPLTGFQQFISRLTTLGLLSMFCTIGSPLALLFSLPALILARNELQKIDRRNADPSNRRVIESNYQSAISTVVISTILSHIWGYFIWLVG